MYTYIYTYTHVHIYMYTCIHRHIYTYIHIHIYICMDIYIYIHTHIYVHIQICIYICIRTHVYTYLHNSCMCACATPCHGSYCELILSLARTSCKLSFPPALLPLRRAGRPPAGPLTDLFAKKSVQIHSSSWRGRRCSVARGSSALVRASSSLSMVHTRAWPRISPSTKIYFCCHFRGLLIWVEFLPESNRQPRNTQSRALTIYTSFASSWLGTQ